MDNFKGEVLSQNIRCLVNHKLKARILKNNMVRDRMNHKEDNLGAKIIKYETFISQNMLQNIKTQELAQFQQQVRQYCGNKNIPTIKSQIAQRSLNMHLIFDEVRKQVKVKEKARRRSKTFQSSQSNIMLLAKPTQLINQKNISCQILRESLGENNQLKRKQKKINVKGKIMNSNLIGFMEKMEDMKYFSNKIDRKLVALIELQSPNRLKEQKQRLNTASDGNQRVKFVPIGKINQGNAEISHSQEKLFVPHMPKIVNKSVQESRQIKKNVNVQKKIRQLRKSTLKLENQLGLKFKNKRKSAQFNQIDRLDEQQDQGNEINCF